MQGSYFQKWKLFLSSYLPLYLWLIFGKIEYTKKFFENIFSSYKWIYFGILILFLVLSVVQLCSVVFQIGGGRERKSIPSEVNFTPENEMLMSYVITYVVPFLSIDLDKPETLISNFVLFIVIGAIYVGNNSLFLNPVLGLIGYKIYGIENYPGIYKCISKMSFDELNSCKINQKTILRYKLSDGVYLFDKTADDE